MKRLMLIAGILVSTISFGAGNPELRNEINEKLYIDLSDIELDESIQDFVIVSFHIFEGKIEINEITGTHKELVQKVKKKLTQLLIEQDYDEELLYRYKFTFEKL